MKYALVLTVAFVGFLVAVPARCFGQGDSNKMGSPYHGLVDNHQQGSDFGWIPPDERGDGESCPDDLGEETDYQKSLRRAYKGRTDRRNTSSPYRLYTTETGVQEASSLALDFTPELIKNNGDVDKNYVVMISSNSCIWCKRMYPMMLELRKKGYIVYIFNTDRDEFKDYGALYNVRARPTFIFYDKGKEVHRFVGKVDSDKVFTDRLKTREDQKEPDTEDSDPYNGI